MGKSKQLAGLSSLITNTSLHKRNKIINGNFDVFERGSSLSSVTSGTFYLADRWKTAVNNATVNVSLQPFVAGQTDVPNAKYFHRHDVTAMATSSSYCHFDHRIEDLRLFDGQTVTLSFYARASANTSMGFEFTNVYGTGGSTEDHGGTNSDYNVGGFNLTTSWQKFTTTVTTLNLTNKTIGSADYFQCRFVPSSSSDYQNARWGGSSFIGQIDLAQVQLEYGDTNTVFETIPYQDVLQQCRRYFYRPVNTSNTEQWVAKGLSNTGGIQVGITFPATMRTIPTIYSNTNPYWESNPWTAIGNTMTVASIATAHLGCEGGDFAIFQNNAVTRGESYNVGAYDFWFDAEF
jgi:hypothetical protein